MHINRADILRAMRSGCFGSSRSGRSGDYLRAVRLSKSSERLLSSRDAVLEIALDAGFDSHEGFSRAFFKMFRVQPQSYRKDPVPIPLFIQSPVRSYLTFLQTTKGGIPYGTTGNA